MKPYTLIDLHCDTLTDWDYTSTGNPDTLNDPKRVIALDKLPADCNWAQLFAIFIPEGKSGQSAIDYFDFYCESFRRQMDKFGDKAAACTNAAEMEAAFSAGKTAAFLTVENGAVLAGNPERIDTVYNAGVRLMTIVWNHENEIASGHDTDHGFSDFGREAVRALAKKGIAIDVSHLNDKGFYELLDLHDGTFLASHSNCRSICSHKRNLTDDMIKHIIERRGVIGLNYYTNFIRDDGNVRSFDDLYAHILHFLELGAEDCLALGSDFDGAYLPDCLNTPYKEAALRDELLKKGLGAELTDKIMYKNAYRFIKDNFR